MAKINVGLYGSAGHQIQQNLENHPGAAVVAYAAFEAGKIPDYFAERDIRAYGSLEELLADDAIELVSFCSPLKDEQGEHVIQCLEAGKHAYVEKPCCMSVAVLDRIIETAARTGKICHEMAATALEEPYVTVREVVASGEIGEVIQVLAQKSYPWADWRPGDERVDGGLALQVWVYPLRFAEHVAGMRVRDLQIKETKLGNQVAGSECRRAVSYLMTFENGGVGSAVANYCCPGSPAWENWGYESLRIFGSDGFVECVDGGRIAQVVVNGKAPRPLAFRSDRIGFFDMFLQEIRTGERVIPFTLEEEIHPTRCVIQAKYGDH